MNLDDEIVVARELASNNDNKFTERIFQQNIQKFRNLLQTSTPYSLSDFEKFLKKLTSSRLFGILVDDNNQSTFYHFIPHSILYLLFYINITI